VFRALIKERANENREMTVVLSYVKQQFSRVDEGKSQ